MIFMYTGHSSIGLDNIPNIFYCRDKKIVLRSVILNGGNHFTAVIRCRNAWMHYDGMDSGLKFSFYDLDNAARASRGRDLDICVYEVMEEDGEAYPKADWADIFAVENQHEYIDREEMSETEKADTENEEEEGNDYNSQKKQVRQNLKKVVQENRKKLPKLKNKLQKKEVKVQKKVKSVKMPEVKSSRMPEGFSYKNQARNTIGKNLCAKAVKLRLITRKHVCGTSGGKSIPTNGWKKINITVTKIVFSNLIKLST